MTQRNATSSCRGAVPHLRNLLGWRAAREALRRVNPHSAIAVWKSLVAADYRNVLPTIAVFSEVNGFAVHQGANRGRGRHWV